MKRKTKVVSRPANSPGFYGELLLIIALLSFAIPARAAITQVDYWRMGEYDSGNSAGLTVSQTTDFIGLRTLTMTGAPTYATPGSSANTHTGSSDCIALGTGTYGLASIISLTNNFGVECWVNASNTSGDQALVYDGNTGGNGWGLYLMNGTYQALFGDITFFGSGAAAAGTWEHLALVVNNGTATFYTNGVAAGTTTSAPIAPSGHFGVAANPGSPGGNPFAGKLDEVRVFTFAVNAFSTNDLLINSGEPGVMTASLSSIGAGSATFNGTVTSDGLDSGGYFEYGTSISYGSTTTATLFAANRGTSNISTIVTGLASSTLYHYQAVATNSAGTNVGGDMVVAVDGPPVIWLVTNASVNETNGDFQATVFPGGASTGVYFNWGLSSNYGLTTSVGNAGAGTSASTVTVQFNNAFPGVTYHFQAVATNANGTNQSSDATVTMLGVSSSMAVTTTNDTGVLGSLRYALYNISSGGTISIGTGTITLASNLPPIFKNVTISGPSVGNATISGANAYRIFFVDPGSGGTVTISNVTLSKGSVIGGAGGSGSGGGGGGMGAGGAVFVNSGALVLSNVNFVSNSAGGGAGGAAPSDGGGGGGGGGLGGSGGAGEVVGGGGGGGLLGNGGQGGEYSGGGGGGLLGSGGQGGQYGGGGGGGLTPGGNGGNSAGGSGGVDGGTGANSGNGDSVANGGNGLLFGGGGGGGYGEYYLNGFGNLFGGSGGNGGAYAGGGPAPKAKTKAEMAATSAVAAAQTIIWPATGDLAAAAVALASREARAALSGVTALPQETPARMAAAVVARHWAAQCLSAPRTARA